MVTASAPSSLRYRWSRVHYDRVIDVGGFHPEARIELLDGVIWERAKQSPPHAAVCGLLGQALMPIAERHEACIRYRSPVALYDVSRPEPDVIVIAHRSDHYMDELPSRPWLIVEVSDTELSFDRGMKLSAYARNGLPEYWLADLVEARLEIYREPSGSEYLDKQVLAARDSVSPLFAPDVTVAIADLLP